MDAPPVSEEDLASIYTWVDEFPLTKPKRSISRDFADGLLVAEMINHLLPKYIEIHNYSQQHSMKQKYYNWETLNTKVFKRMGFQLSKNDIEAVVNAQPLAIERILKVLQVKTEKVLQGLDGRENVRPPDSEYQGSNSGGGPQVQPGRQVEKTSQAHQVGVGSTAVHNQRQAQNKGTSAHNNASTRAPVQQQQYPDPNGTTDGQGLNLPVPPVYYPGSNQRKE